MTPQESKEFGQVISATRAMYDKDTDAMLIRLWFNTLKHLELADIVTAIERHMQDPDSGRFSPKPADVIAHLSGGSATRSLSAWSKVEKAIGRAGMHCSVCFDDPLINRVIDEMGGWVKLAGIETFDDLKFRGIDFAKRYTGLMQTGGAGGDYPAYLLGVSESQNMSAGRVSEPPTLIGDPVKAQAVMDRAKGSAALRLTRAGESKQIVGGEKLKLVAPVTKDEDEGEA